MIYGWLIRGAIVLGSALFLFGLGFHYGGKGPRAQLAQVKAETAEFKARLEVQAKAQREENERIQIAAESASRAAAVQVRDADARAAAAQRNARDRLRAAGDLRGVAVPRVVRDIFDASARGTSEAPAAAAGTDARSGPAAPASEVKLDVLLETVITNNENHLRCVGQVLGLQKYATTLYQSCGGTK